MRVPHQLEYGSWRMNSMEGKPENRHIACQRLDDVNKMTRAPTLTK